MVEYVSVKLPRDLVEELWRLAGIRQQKLGRRVTIAEVLRDALELLRKQEGIRGEA